MQSSNPRKTGTEMGTRDLSLFESGARLQMTESIELTQKAEA